MKATSFCPYCLTRPRDSRDHVFPEFLGGTRTIRACQSCNSQFGSDFEGFISKQLEPVIVALSFSGYKHKRTVVHTRAWVDETTGIEYNLDSDRRSYPSKPHLIRENGEVKRIVAGNTHQITKILASLKKKTGVTKAIAKREVKEIPIPPLRKFNIQVGSELRQLAVKMCVAMGQLVVPDIVLLDQHCRAFLLAKGPALSPVRQIHLRYPELDALRPPLAHAIYVEGDATTGRCFGVVQLFGGVFQFYVPLSGEYSGKDVGILGTLDIVTFCQDFREVTRLHLAEAPQFVSGDEAIRSLDEVGEHFNAQVKAAFGKNAILLGASEKQSVSGFRVTLPLLWIENELQVQFTLDLLPDRVPDKAASLPTDPRQWVISADLGKTTLPVFDTFVENWNNNLLNRERDRAHRYVPPEIMSGVRLLMGEDFWCPIKAMEMTYHVIRHAWLGSIVLPDCYAEIDRSENTLNTRLRVGQDDIPNTREPSWPEIADPDEFERTNRHVVVVERWDVNAKNLKFTEMFAETKRQGT